MRRMADFAALAAIGLLVVISMAAAQVVSKVPYQAQITCPPDCVCQDVNVTFKLGSGDSAGISGGIRYTEGISNLAVDQNGFVSYMIGGTEPLSADVFDTADIVLEVEINGEEVGPAVVLGSVPYSFITERIAGDISTGPGRLEVPLAPTSGLAKLVLGDTLETSGRLECLLIEQNDTIAPSLLLISTWWGSVDTLGGISREGLLRAKQYNIGVGNVNPGVTAMAAGSFGRARGDYSIVAGGGGSLLSDSNYAFGEGSTVSGGTRNGATGAWATVGGGGANTALGSHSVVAGGAGNGATQNYSSVGGGRQNLAGGLYAQVTGGRYNEARGDYSFAAGYNARATDIGSVVIAANALTYDSIKSGGEDQMVLRADGGIYVTNHSGTAPYDVARLINTSSGAYLSTAGAWTNVSDRNLKENFATINGRELLEKLAGLEVREWNYKNDPDKARHVGPVAQDFYAVFGLGNDDKSISTVDPSGIALAAIQALSVQLREKSERIDELESRVAELESLVRRLAQRGSPTERE